MHKANAAREVKLIDIGNSKGIRIPKSLLQKFGWSDSLVLEETETGISLHGGEKNKLSWAETYRAMAAEPEDWSDRDATLADGID
ncbi:MAG: AbrB/MazE/SpoVT family DNA-binding domain-containing protein [Thiotrichales bacterium]|nr:AbrB/MazE/SpoVT family DNA-binding domain-containing protein [Thiotrichales bacterium]